MKRFWSYVGAAALIAGGAGLAAPQAARSAEGGDSKEVSVAKRAGGKSKTLEGKVESFRKNPNGDVDGLVLVGGEEVRFPPHVGRRVAEAVEKGDEVRIDAEEKTSPRGELEFRGMSLALAKGGDEIDLSAPPPHGPKEHGPKHGEPRPPHERGPDHGPPHGRGEEKGPPHERGGEHAPPHERILSELREIRGLLEEKGKGKPREEEHGAPHERMLAELREIRELLGVKGKPREEEDGPPHEQVLRELRELKEAVSDRAAGGRRPPPRDERRPEPKPPREPKEE